MIEPRGAISSEMEVNNLFESAMKGQWNKVVEAYEKNPMIQEAKITKSQDTALHIAVADGQTHIVLKLVETMGKNAPNILKIKNDRGNTALHLAAALGHVQMCRCMASKDPKLLAARNNESETPLFLAALHGKKAAFLCLHYFSQDKENSSSGRKNNGDTILHSAICGEYFSLAYQIIQYYPDLVNSVNENGLTPLHILASKPTAFNSSSRLGLFDRIIYHCIYVAVELKEDKHDHEAWSNDSRLKSGLSYPKNYKTCIKFFRLIKTSIRVLTKTQGEADDEASPQQTRIISQGDTLVGSSSSERELASKDQITGSSDVKKGSKKGLNQSKKKDKEDKLYPPNYATCLLFFRLMWKALLVILGLGIWRINYITEKKEKHKWANQIMNELVQLTSIYKYEDNGRNPGNSRPENPGDAFSIPETPPVPDNDGITPTGNTNAGIDSSIANQNRDDNGRDQRPTEKRDKPILVAAKIEDTEMVDRFLESYPAAIQELNASEKNLVLLNFDKIKAQQSGRKETPILIAAKMGVAEMVEKILNIFPVAIQDLDSNNKNVALLAVENRQTRIYKLLLNRKMLRETVLRQVDNEGNSALHLAATFGEYRPWLIPGAAFEMQWEIKWYEFVKKSMPRNFFVRYNNKGKTPKEIFTETHKNLVKEGREWLTKTSESCSVVAALIATVAFATSATVPGGVDQRSGKPILENEPVFNVFAISSLVALCFSVTALVFFLSILTSRYQEKDFAMDLPRKLLLGLTTLFTSIVAILISFCSGHSFVIKDQMRSASYPIYAATCLPMTYFAVAQVPLYFDLVWAILAKVPQRSYTVLPH
ncbi:putative Ankyrin repeat-containing protein [Melia azedarach]|uniref:Ankyrin repeat-containing protein n=1 Tax=Melia azedarach TaxID=155640 RepID=A0ACC1YIN9_MELAZ|nr:putative Ankyrin repeat-containing protein [Melia azedarach]